MTPAVLVAELRARGVTLRPDGETLRVRPVSKVTAEELAALRCHKAEVLALLTREPATLDPTTVLEVLGEHPDPHDLGCLRLDIQAAVRQLEREVATGAIAPALRLVRGRPLADWLDLDAVAQLFRLWDQRTRPESGAR